MHVNIATVDVWMRKLFGLEHGWWSPPASLSPWTRSQKNWLNVLSCDHDDSLKTESRSETFCPVCQVCQFCLCQSGVQSHLSFSLLMDPVSELDHLCVDAWTVEPRAALTPAHDPRQEPPPASLQTHQRTSWITLSDTQKKKKKGNTWKKMSAITPRGPVLVTAD